MKSNISTKHPLIGTWITSDEDSDATFIIGVKDGKFQVAGFTRSDKEKFIIKDVKWDGTTLRFYSLMPSTNFKTVHAFRANPDGTAEVEFTWWETWKKMTPKRGGISKKQIL